MVAFEPSTWAEVEEAQAMGKTLVLRGSNALVADVVRFTDAPERSLLSMLPERRPPQPPPRPRSPDPASKKATPGPRYDVAAQRLIRAKRNDMHFEDILRLGRVNLQNQSLGIRGGGTGLERSLAADAAKPLATVESPLNPSCESWNPNEYLRVLHANTPRAQLVSGLQKIDALLRAVDAQADALRTAAFPSVCLVAAELNRSRAMVDTKATESEKSPLVADGTEFARAENALAKTYATVTGRQDAVGRLDRVLDILGRFGWVFEISARMRANAHAQANVEVLEKDARDYKRAREWAESQKKDGAAAGRVKDDLDNALIVFNEAITDRLADARASRAIMKRCVGVLVTVGGESNIVRALDARMVAARERLSSVVASAHLVPSTGTGQERADGAALSAVKAATVAFIAGLSTYWRLACVVALYESCAVHANSQLPSFIAYYVAAVETTGSLARDAVVEVLRAHAVASSTLKIPSDYIASLRALADNVLQKFIASRGMAVVHAAKDAASAVLESRVDSRAAARLVRAVVVEALSQVDEVLLRRRSGANSKRSTGNLEAKEISPSGPTHQSVKELRIKCAKAFETAVNSLETSLNDSSYDGALALRVAVFCVAVLEDTGIRDALPDMEKTLKTTNERVDQVRVAAVRAYVVAAAPALEARARRVVLAYSGSSGGNEPAPRHKDGRVSAAASELLLELALAALDARRRGAGADVAAAVARELIMRTGAALCSAAASTKLEPAHASRVRADCDFLAAALHDTNAEEGFMSAAKISADMCEDTPLSARRAGGTQHTVVAAVRHVSLLKLCLAGKTPEGEIPPNH